MERWFTDYAGQETITYDALPKNPSDYNNELLKHVWNAKSVAEIIVSLREKLISTKNSAFRCQIIVSIADISAGWICVYQESCGVDNVCAKKAY